MQLNNDKYYINYREKLMSEKIKHHTVTSELGEKFIHFASYVKTKLTADEFSEYTKLSLEDPSEWRLEYVELYNQWLIDQKITHTIIFDDNPDVPVVHSHTDEI